MASTANESRFNESTDATEVELRLPGLIDDETSEWLTLIFLIVMGTPLCLFGIIANIINIVTFAKQGFKDNITVSLMCLSVFDLASILALLIVVIAMNPLVRYHPDVPFDAPEVLFLFGSMPRLYFTRLSSIVTMYNSVERCFSVIRPLTFKRIFTRSNFAIMLSGTIVILTANMSIIYYGTRLTWKIDPITNETYLGTYFIKDRHLYTVVPFAIHSILAYVCFFANIISAVFLIGALQNRKQIVANIDKATEKTKFLSTKDKRVAKTVAYLAAMFVVCYLPTTSYQSLTLFFQEFNRRKRYENIFFNAWYFAYIMEGLCASCNIFVYLKTSSKFKKTFYSVFMCGDKDN